MQDLFLGGLTALDVQSAGSASAAKRAVQAANEARSALIDLEHQVARLSLLNQALWELIRDRLHLTDADLERMAHDVDLRDGRQDGQISATAVRCPTCGRVNNSKHAKCLYCGQLFEKPAFG